MVNSTKQDLDELFHIYHILIRDKCKPSHYKRLNKELERILNEYKLLNKPKLECYLQKLNKPSLLDPKVLMWDINFLIDLLLELLIF